MYEIETNSKAPRAQGGEGLLSRSISYKSLENPKPKNPNPREEGRNMEEEVEEETPGRGGSSTSGHQARSKEERVGE